MNSVSFLSNGSWWRLVQTWAGAGRHRPMNPLALSGGWKPSVAAGTCWHLGKAGDAVNLLRCINQTGRRGLLFKLMWRRLRRAEHLVSELTLCSRILACFPEEIILSGWCFLLFLLWP